MTAPAFTPASAIADALDSAFHDTMVDGGTPEGELARGADGRFRPRESEEIDATPELDADGKPIAPETTPAAGSKDGKPAKPATDGERVELPPADPATLMTSFTLKDAQGELAIPQGLLIEYTANGKQRTDSLDKVVKLAQMGHYQVEREQRIHQVEAQSEEIRSYAADVDQRLARREAQMTQLLNDPDFRERAIQEYQAQQTPEKQLERKNQEMEQMRLQQERQQITQANAPMRQKVLQAYDLVVEAVPNVSAHEIGQKLDGFLNRLKDPRTGLVPPRPDVQAQINQFFLDDLIPWAQSLDDYRATQNGTRSGKQSQVASAQAAEKTKADLDAANVRAAKARRAASANLRPAGQRGTSRGTPAQAPTTAEGILEDVIQSTKAAVGYGS